MLCSDGAIDEYISVRVQRAGNAAGLSDRWASAYSCPGLYHCRGKGIDFPFGLREGRVHGDVIRAAAATVPHEVRGIRARVSFGCLS